MARESLTPIGQLAPNGHLDIDSSLLTAEATCGFLAWCKYAQRRQPAEPRHAMDAGTALHKMHEFWHKGASEAEVLAAVAHSYLGPDDAPIDRTTAPERLSVANLLALARAWMHRYPLSALPYLITSQHTELGLRWPFCTLEVADSKGKLRKVKIALCGRMDALVQMADSTYVLDFKTTGDASARWWRLWPLSAQLSAYAWLVGQHTDEPVAGCIISVLEVDVVPGSARKCPKHNMPYADCGAQHIKTSIQPFSRTSAQLAEWHKGARHLAQRYVERLRRYPNLASAPHIRQTGAFSGKCQDCDLLTLCQTDRSESMIMSMTKPSFWHPLAGPEGAGKGEGERKGPESAEG